MRTYSNYKYSGISPIGDIPSEWNTVRLKAVFDEVNDRYDTSLDESLPLLSVSEYYGVAERAEKIEDEAILIRASTLDGYKKCKAGDFVSNIMLAWKCAMGKSPKDGIVSPAYCVYRIKPGVNISYYHYLLRTGSYGEIYKTHSTGIIDSRLRLYTDEFFSIYVPVPTEKEQATIASFLDDKVARIDHVIDEAKASIEEYKQWKASIIYEAVTKGLDPEAEMVDSGVEWIGMMPNEWRVAKLKNFIDILPGYAFPSEGFLPEGIPLLRGINVTPNGIRWDDVVYWNEEDTAYLKPFALEIGDVVMGLDRPWISSGTRIATIHEQDVPSYLLQRVCRIRVINQADIRFVKYWLASDSFMKSLATETTGISVPHISTNQIQNFVVAMPTLEIQERICDYLDNTCARIDSLISEKDLLIADLEAYKKSLIFEVVTGKRKVV